mmetsp:Transcript_45213/g.83670  ORF Transcript_45213/g.83670 Transcript_45213/m.83670 type:complete len:90 (+) Transcript_45213:1235-1504(+)
MQMDVTTGKVRPTTCISSGSGKLHVKSLEVNLDSGLDVGKGQASISPFELRIALHEIFWHLPEICEICATTTTSFKIWKLYEFSRSPKF